MTTYKLTRDDQPAARIIAIRDYVADIEVEMPGLPGMFSPVHPQAHPEVWSSIVKAFRDAPRNGYTVTAESLLTLTDYETAPVGTIATHPHFNTKHTKQDVNQWTDADAGETISDEYMAQRGAAQII